ncbi:MAG: M18 family aminopeptidase, partial [Selenomonadaceae bacterium]
LKLAANQSYAGDAEAVAIAAELCQQNNIPCQRFVNRSDMVGGSTLGSIASTLLPIRTMDIGVPILAMHSARETMGVKDQQSLEDMMKAFFSEK